MSYGIHHLPVARQTEPLAALDAAGGRGRLAFRIVGPARHSRERLLEGSA